METRYVNIGIRGYNFYRLTPEEVKEEEDFVGNGILDPEQLEEAESTCHRPDLWYYRPEDEGSDQEYPAPASRGYRHFDDAEAAARNEEPSEWDYDDDTEDDDVDPDYE